MTESSLSIFDPLVADWFRVRYGRPTEIQAGAWRAVAGGAHVLITAPTGSGKTMAAFLWALDQWITGRWETGRTQVVYVSPLKALNNDIRRNVRSPLSALAERFGQAGREFPEIRVQTRSGDTPASERRGMLRRPPEILITTPESLHLLLSSAGGRTMLGHVRTVLLDEIHAVLGSRRGTLLMTAVERLVRLGGEFQRIGMSATMQPLETAARFMGGYRMSADRSGPRYVSRPVTIVAPRASKRYNLAVRVPAVPESPRDPNDFWDAFAECIRGRLAVNRSTLVFANSRRLCEKLTFLINRGRGELLAYAHHGALSREIRTEVERRLKAGALKAILATGSLELGIDIGALDEVILVQAPWSVAEAVQRIGRAGHGVGETSRGFFLSAHLADQVGSAVAARAVAQGDIEPEAPLRAPLDVLAQVLLSMLSFEAWDPDDLYDFIRTAAPYHELTRRQFDLVVDMLAGRYAENRLRALQPRILYDRIDRRLEARKGAVLALYTSGGVIPDRGYYALRHAHTGAKIGELDEEFVWEARIGQVFTLGAQNWRIRRITASEVRVLPAASGRPAPPFWRAEERRRGFHLSEKIGLFLQRAESRLADPDFSAELMAAYAMDEAAAQSLIHGLKQQRAHTGTPLPHRRHLLVEETPLGTGRSAGRQVICHTLWGGRVNRPLTVALEAAWEARYGTAPQIFCTNDTITFLLPPDLAGEPLLDLVRADNFETLLHQRLPQSGFFAARFRECAGRALLLPRRPVNRRMPLWLTRLQAQKLLSQVAGYPDFPILAETWRTCLQDEFDLARARHLLEELEAGEIARSHVHTPYPSPMARAAAWQQVNVHMYQDDQGAAGGGRLGADLLREVSLDAGLRPRIDPALAAQFEAKRRRLAPGYAPDSAPELLDWLKERLLLPWTEWQGLCAAASRDHGLEADDTHRQLADKVVLLRPAVEWEKPLVAAHELLPALAHGLYAPAGPGLEISLLDHRPLPIPAIPTRARPKADGQISAAADQLGQWLRFYGPRTPDAISRELGIPPECLTPLIATLADAETVIVGALLEGGAPDEVCDRENFETLLRLSRKAQQAVVETLPLERLALFLARFQGVTPHPKEAEEMTVRLNQLLCWPAPAGLWESEILPARLPGYRPEQLDALIQRHALRWVGAGQQKVLFCFQEDLDLIAAEQTEEADLNEERPDALATLFADTDARYPFAALERLAAQGSAALHDRLWQWAWQGRVTNDTFAALRRGVANRFTMGEAGAAPARRHGRGPGRSMFQRWRGSRPAEGNWFRLPRTTAGDDPIDREERNRERVRLLLDRYGIVFRELLARELPALRWSPLFRALRLMELSGEVVAGHFFEGIEGLQFISPAGLALLDKALPDEAVFWINALDPASLCGLELAALRGRLPRRLPGVHLVYHGDRPVIVSHGLAGRLEIRVAADHPRLKAYFAFLDHLLTRSVTPLRSIRIRRINDSPAADQAGYVAVLKDLFETVVDHREVTLYRRHGGA